MVLGNYGIVVVFSIAQPEGTIIMRPIPAPHTAPIESIIHASINVRNCCDKFISKYGRSRVVVALAGEVASAKAALADSLQFTTGVPCIDFVLANILS